MPNQLFTWYIKILAVLSKIGEYWGNKNYLHGD
jgi:hypothetical protein